MGPTNYIKGASNYLKLVDKPWSQLHYTGLNLMQHVYWTNQRNRAVNDAHYIKGKHVKRQ